MAPRHHSKSNERRPEDNTSRRRASPVRELIAVQRQAYRSSSPLRRPPGHGRRRSRSPQSNRDYHQFRARSPVSPSSPANFGDERSAPRKDRDSRHSNRRSRRSESPQAWSGRGREEARYHRRRRSRDSSPVRSPQREVRRDRDSPRRHSPDSYLHHVGAGSRSLGINANRPGSPRYRSDHINSRGHAREDDLERPEQSRDLDWDRRHRSARRAPFSRSPSPEQRYRSRRSLSRSSHRKYRRRSLSSDDRLIDDMRPSYSYSRGGQPRSGRPPPIVTSHYPSHSPYYSGSPTGQSPYGRNEWIPSHGYPPSHPGSPPYPPQPYRQTSFPPPAPSPTYFPSQSHYNGPPPAGGLSHSSSPYRGPYDRQPSNHHSPPDRGPSNPSLERFPQGRDASSRGRGHYTNLSWTPATGSRGGIQVPSKTRASPVQKSGNTGDDSEDDPFRPSKDLQVEDQSGEEPPKAATVSSQSDQTSAKPNSNGDNKFSFTLKSKAVPANANSAFDFANSMHNPLSAKPKAADTNSHVQKHPSKVTDARPDRRSHHNKSVPDDGGQVSGAKPGRENKQEQRAKRTETKRTLPPELAASDSVYHRKPGNESVVGSGTYGKVFRAIHVYTGEKVALKKIRMEGERDGFPVTAIREVKLLQSLHHDNIVKLHEVMVEKNDCYMVFEYLSHDLTGLLNHPTFRLEESHKKDLAKQLFEGLDYLHRRGVLHRDIKAANILISNSGQLKLADFGLARFYAKRRQLDYTNRVITIWYRSPELLLGETQYGAAVDIWSAACVLVEIFTKHAIFPGDGGELNQLDRIYNVLGTPTRAEWPEVVDMSWFELLRPTERRPSTFAEKYRDRVTAQSFDLLSMMFSYNPQKRPTAAEVLAHPFFTEEEPQPRSASELKGLEGDWHEFESKALRKEKERMDREARRLAKEQDNQASQKRGAEQDDFSSDVRGLKRAKLLSDGEAPDTALLI